MVFTPSMKSYKLKQLIQEMSGGSSVLFTSDLFMLSNLKFNQIRRIGGRQFLIKYP